MSCPFYGKGAALQLGRLVDTMGNQCALILDKHAPCYMEALLRREPKAAACELLAAAGSRYEWERRISIMGNPWEPGPTPPGRQS